jgi:hypothetical protein
MPRCFFRNLLGLSLAAMMLVTSIFPPSFRHSHQGGNDLHHEHFADSSSHFYRIAGNECQENSHSCHSRPSTDVYTLEDSLGDETTHRHFQFLGFSIALPDTYHSPKSGDDSQNNQFVSIRATENILPVTQSNSDTRNWLIQISQDYSPHSMTVFSAIPHSLQPVALVLLCDSARHERSGVQLT